VFDQEQTKIVPGTANVIVDCNSVKWTVERFRQSFFYDLLLRLPLVIWSILLAMVAGVGIARYIAEAEHETTAVFAINVAMRLATIGFLILLATVTIARMRPSGRAPGIEPRLSALLGTLLPSAVIFFPRHELSPIAEVISTVLILVGNALSIFVLTQLGRAFSVMAEARQLVATGVYRYVRHPLYLAEEIAIIGIYMQFISIWTTLLIAAQFAFQLRRMHNEEAFLSQVLPDYLPYRERTARLIPGIY